MSGENVTFFKDKEKQHLIFPKTKTNAVSDSSGAILDSILSSIKSNIETEKQNNKIFTATFKLDAWNNSNGMWTQSTICNNMKAEYNTTAPWFNKTGIEDTDIKLQNTMNILSCGKLETSNGKLIATVKTKPYTDITIFMKRTVTD